MLKIVKVGFVMLVIAIVCIAFQDSKYWLSLLALLCSASVGECLRDFLFADGSPLWRRFGKIALACLGLLVPGLVFNIPLFVVPSAIGLIGLMCAFVLHDALFLDKAKSGAPS